MVINTNIPSILAQQNLNNTQDNLQKTMESLASGKRVNSAADDAAGLAIITRMTSASRGMNVSARNINDAISLLQTADSANGTITNILQRMRDLAVQADNGTYTTTDKQSMQNEYVQLQQEIDHVANNAQFNGVNLTNGTTTVATFHVSNLSTDTISASLYNATSIALGVNALNLTTSATQAIALIDVALQSVSTYRANFGAIENRLNFTLQNVNISKQNLQSAQSRIEDADVSMEVSNQVRDLILSQSALSILTQANQQPKMLLKLL